MKTRTKILLLLLLPVFSMAQKSRLDTLRIALKAAHVDSARFTGLSKLGEYYTVRNSDSSVYYNSQALAIAEKNNKAMEEAEALDAIGYDLMHLHRFTESLEAYQRALKLAEDTKSENEQETWNTDFNGLKNHTRHNFRLDILASIHHDFGHLLGVNNNTNQQIEQYRITSQLAAQVEDKGLLSLVDMNLGAAYVQLNRLDAALQLELDAERIMKQVGYRTYISYVYSNIADIYMKKKKMRLWPCNIFIKQ